MANDIDAWKDLKEAEKYNDKKGWEKILKEIERGDYGPEAQNLYTGSVWTPRKRRKK